MWHTSRCLLCILATLLSCVGVANAQPTLSGKWQATPLRVQWSIGDWGAACGPRPGGGGQGGGTVTITQSGNELSIAGVGRTYSTTQCWEQYPGLQRRSHSAGKRGWRNVCKTAATDPRQANVITTISATDSSISFDETGQYQFVIKGQNCTASVRRTRSFSLMQRAGEPAEPATPAPGAKAETPSDKQERRADTPGRCGVTGPAVKLEVSPARKLMRAGESFQFRARVLDKQGCLLAEKPTWRLVEGDPLVKLGAGGRIEVKPEAGEGEAKVSVQVKGRAVEVVIEVASKERYEAMLKTGGFNRAGESTEAAAVAIATGSVGGREVESKATQNRTTQILAVVGALALCLGVFGLVLVQRSRRRRQRREAEAAAAEAAATAAAAAHAASQPAPPSNKICPMCGQLYPPQAQFCGKDGASLVPVN